MTGFDLSTLIGGGGWAALTALFQVLMIDLVLAGDNAVAVGLAASGLEPKDRKRVILAGLAVAVVLRIGFALITTQLLAVIGLLFAGGILLLWVCWKMWRELREQQQHAEAESALEHATGVDIDGEPGRVASRRKPKTFREAFIQVLIADVSMSLDNVLAVAGAAREHPAVLVVGLLASIALMGVAASWIARLLHKYSWIGFIGLVIVLYVALHMMWQGHREVVVDLGRTAQYNAFMPDFLDIKPGTPSAH
ncbi:MAG: tellurium resistance protein TerC [Caulobacterales bacterium 32-69-10]|nr:MAG: tellurium resistance protein TerC [Caulobacterales bacterium 32-69-10]